MCFYNGIYACVFKMGAVVNDWIGGNEDIMFSFAVDIGATMTRLAHHAIDEYNRRQLEKNEKKDDT